MSAPGPLVYVWEPDPFVSDDWYDDPADKAYVREHGAVQCTLYRACPAHGAKCPHAEVLASLSAIVESQDATERDAYRREVEAQLAAEAGVSQP